MNRGIARRLAALEARLQPVEMPIWSPWQRILSEDEFWLLMDFARRPGRYALYPRRGSLGDGIEWLVELCEDDAERATFAAILAKKDAPFPPGCNLAREGYGLSALFADLCL